MLLYLCNIFILTKVFLAQIQLWCHVPVNGLHRPVLAIPCSVSLSGILLFVQSASSTSELKDVAFTSFSSNNDTVFSVPHRRRSYNPCLVCSAAICCGMMKGLTCGLGWVLLCPDPFAQSSARLISLLLTSIQLQHSSHSCRFEICHVWPSCRRNCLRLTATHGPHSDSVRVTCGFQYS